MHKLTVGNAVAALHGSDFARFLERPEFDVSLYRPGKVDPQTPHKRDELYVIASGRGDFFCDGETEPFAAGDVFFVPAGVEHRFRNFSSDFTTWVIFLGKRP